MPTEERQRRVHSDLTFDPDRDNRAEIISITVTAESCRKLDGVKAVDDSGVEGFKGETWFVELENPVPVKKTDGVETRFFLISGAHVPYLGWECVAFPATEDRELINFRDHAGGTGYSHRDTIEELVNSARFR